MSLMISTGAFPPSGTQELGFVYGTSCLSRNFARDMTATVRNATVGGELKTYSDMMSEGVELAKERMLEMASTLGADGVYAVHIATPQVAGGAAEVIMYGTAFRKI
ncbi:MAG: YbjQ family protein [Fretibacterium sp.]|nr:YbjQ family protein [Fretibacterium sp.]